MAVQMEWDVNLERMVFVVNKPVRIELGAVERHGDSFYFLAWERMVEFSWPVLVEISAHLRRLEREGWDGRGGT